MGVQRKVRKEVTKPNTKAKIKSFETEGREVSHVSRINPIQLTEGETNHFHPGHRKPSKSAP